MFSSIMLISRDSERIVTDGTASSHLPGKSLYLKEIGKPVICRNVYRIVRIIIWNYLLRTVVIFVYVHNKKIHNKQLKKY